MLPDWSLAPVVKALQALRGIGVVTAATIMVEVGDLSSFESPRQLMGYLGLVPGERSTGDTVRRLGITKAGNGRLRRALVESAWTYRHPPRTGAAKHTVLETLPSAVKRHRVESADTAVRPLSGAVGPRQAADRRSHGRARELAGFVWAIGREVQTGAEPHAPDRRHGRTGAGAGQRQGNSRRTLCGRPADARSKTGKAPDA